MRAYFLLPAFALTCSNRSHAPCAIIGECHRAAALGAIKEPFAEFAFNSVDLVDELELVQLKRFGGNGKGGMLGRRRESL
nr:hypothetical protein [Mycobacterium sp. 1274756.6]